MQIIKMFVHYNSIFLNNNKYLQILGFSPIELTTINFIKRLLLLGLCFPTEIAVKYYRQNTLKLHVANGLLSDKYFNNEQNK